MENGARAELETGRARWLGVTGLVLFALALVARAPGLIFPGRFWAEDGTVFFHFAWTHSLLQALVAPHQGYYSLVGNVAGILAAQAPLKWAPSVASFCGLLVQVIPAGLILFTTIRGERPALKVAALLILLFVPTNTEVYLNTANSQFLLATAAGLILISEHGGARDRWGKWLLLGVAGLTGMIAIFLTPFFWWQWWREKRRERLVQAVILTVGAGLQALAMHQAAGQIERPLHFKPTLIVGVTYAKFVVEPVTSFGNFFNHLDSLRGRLAETGSLPGWIWVAAAAGVAVFLLICGWSRNRSAWLLAGAGAWLCVFSVAGSLGDDVYNLMGFSPRYYYAPQVFCCLAVLLALASAKPLPFTLKAVAAGWLGMVLVVGLFNFVSGPAYLKDVFSGSAWQPQVERWEADATTPLVVWPDTFRMNLPRK